MIRAFVVDTATGETRARVQASGATDYSDLDLPPDQVVVLYRGPGDFEELETYLDGELKLRARTVDPALALAVAQAEAVQRMLARRDLAEFGGIRMPEGIVQTDDTSQRKINGAVTMALIAQAAGQPFSIDWTMLDNSSATYDAAGMIAMGVAVGQHVAACHEAALAKRAAIDAATTPDEVALIDLDSGWPPNT